MYPLKEIEEKDLIGSEQEDVNGIISYIEELSLQYPYTKKMDIQIDPFSGDFTELKIYKICNEKTVVKSIDFTTDKTEHYNAFDISYDDLLSLYSKFDSKLKNIQETE